MRLPPAGTGCCWYCAEKAADPIEATGGMTGFVEECVVEPSGIELPTSRCLSSALAARLCRSGAGRRCAASIAFTAEAARWRTSGPSINSESVEAVWAFRANVAGARHVEHLLLELREAANVADLTLSVERGDRLGPDCLAARRRDGLDRHVRASGRDHVLDHGAAEASFGDDAVGPELVIGGHCEPCPLCRAETCRAIGKHIA